MYLPAKYQVMVEVGVISSSGAATLARAQGHFHLYTD